jgi:hypothetical protein
MALNQSPQIVTNGLAFYYDMGNPQKSWRGAPTTNYITFPEASYNGSSFVNFGYNYANLGATYTYGAGVSNPVNAPGVLQYFTGTTGYKFFSIDSTSLPVTGTYTFSYYARLVGSGSNNVGNGQLWRANGSDRGVTGDWNPTFTSEWRRYSTTGPAEAGTILQYFPIHSGSITGGYTIEYCGFQLEVGSYATPFVIGSRSNTQAVVDLTGNTTITASSLTYNSNGTFSFNGSSNFISIANSSTIRPATELTIEYIIQGVTPPSWNPILGYGNGDYTNGNYLVWIEAGGGLHGLCRVNNTEYRCTPAQNISNSILTHVIYTMKTGDAIRPYFNGVASVTTTSLPIGTFTYNATASSYQVSGSGGSWFNGSIPIVKFYNRALTAAEVQQNFNALKGRYGL